MPLQIGFLVFPGVQQLDLTGPYEVFAGLPDVALHLVWKTLDPIESATRLRLIPTVTIADCPPLDVVCVPGGVGVNRLMQDDETLDFLRAQAASARFVTSVCTGALALGAAGLLRGRRATTHWRSHDLLAAFGAVPVAGRVVRDGGLITGGGVTAGIDFALTLVAELAGRAAAEAIQLNLEYAPAPPFHAGTPAQAPRAAVETVVARTADLRREREGIIARLGGAVTSG